MDKDMPLEPPKSASVRELLEWSIELLIEVAEESPEHVSAITPAYFKALELMERLEDDSHA